MVKPMGWTDEQVTEAVITRARRVPLPEAVPGDGTAVTRQLDAALVSAGFKLSAALMRDLSARDTGQVLDIGVGLLAAARKIAGDHVRHNPYFRDFPFNVPDTVEFWAELIAKALLGDALVATGTEAARMRDAIAAGEPIDIGDGEMVMAGSLLSLPGYGKVQHTYEDMLAAHEALAASAGDRVTLLHKGWSLDNEATGLYTQLAGSRVPLAGEDRELLAALARRCVSGPQPERIPVRENRALINEVALEHGCVLLADTVTDVLRLLTVTSGGDVTLETATRFRSLPRADRRVIMATLETVVAANAAKLRDVPRYAEEWKRAGERLHPHEYPDYPQAQRVFAVARGEEDAPSVAAMVDLHVRSGQRIKAAQLLRHAAPGMLARSLDRLLRDATPGQASLVLRAMEQAAPDVSARVLLSAREHFQNRVGGDGQGLPRIFANRSGRAWVRPEDRPGIDKDARNELLALLDEEIGSRLPSGGRLIVDPAVLGVALPLSGKPAAPGLGVMPRGSVSDVVPGDQDVLTFFNYWREEKHRTDYDLSALLTTREFDRTDWVSWQSFGSADGAVVYSGDVTSAPDGATEFISVDLRHASLPVIVPQVLVYSGEPFDEAAESFFGYDLRAKKDKGAPFEAATVRMKSELRGNGKVALPLAFIRGDDGKWRVKWLHFYLKGSPQFNVVQGHKVTASLLARTVIERDYLQVRYLTALAGVRAADGIAVPMRTPDMVSRLAAESDVPVTYIGLERPDGLPDGTTVITLNNLSELIPDLR